MLRAVSAALRGIAARTASINVTNAIVSTCNPALSYAQCRGFGALSAITQKWATARPTQRNLLLSHPPVDERLALPAEPINVPIRTVIKFSLQKGKRKTVKAVLHRFYRLNWGIWIRTKTGRDKHLWKKSAARKKRLQRHVFCNATQSNMLDKMVSAYWRRPVYYVDDPYNPYHEREEFWITRRKPLP